MEKDSEETQRPVSNSEGEIHRSETRIKIVLQLESYTVNK